MTVRYHFQRQGRTYGPVSGTQLRELVAGGNLSRDDLVRREDAQNWTPAGTIRGLFGEVAQTSSELLPPAPDRLPAGARVPVADEGRSLEPSRPAVSGSSAPDLLAGTNWQARLAQWRPLAEHYSREYELGMRQFLAAVTGSTCLFLLILSTFLTWEVWAMEAGDAMPGVGNSESYSGLDVLEGKFVCLLAVIGIGTFGATLAVKRLLPASLLVAAAVGTCSLLLTMSYKHQINEYDAESARQARVVGGNFDATFGAEEGRAASEQLIPRETDESGLGLYLAILASLVIASTFIFAAWFKPITLPFLQKDGIHPLARRHGALMLTQAVAFLLGLTDFVMQF